MFVTPQSGTISGSIGLLTDSGTTIIDNAGSAAQIAIYRAPDLGTTGALPVAHVLNVLRSHQVIGVDTKDLKEITVTRLAHGLPVGGELDYLDDGTLTAALKARRPL